MDIDPRLLDARNVADSICDDIIHAQDYFRVFRAVAQRANENLEAIDWCPEFWNPVIFGLRDSAVLRLARLYDKTKDAWSLRTWLQSMKTGDFRAIVKDHNLHHFDAAIANSIDADIKLVEDKDAAVKRLSDFRSKRLVHNDKLVVIGPVREKLEFSITYGEIADLIDRAKSIYNRYMAAAFGHQQCFDLPGGRDWPQMAVDAMVTYVAEEKFRNNVEHIRELMKLRGFD